MWWARESREGLESEVEANPETLRTPLARTAARETGETLQSKDSCACVVEG